MVRDLKEYREWLSAQAPEVVLSATEQRRAREAAKRAIQVRRYERALVLLKKAKSRFKRARTLLRKYERTVTYYRKALGD